MADVTSEWIIEYVLKVQDRVLFGQKYIHYVEYSILNSWLFIRCQYRVSIEGSWLRTNLPETCSVGQNGFMYAWSKMRVNQWEGVESSGSSTFVPEICSLRLICNTLLLKFSMIQWGCIKSSWSRSNLPEICSVGLIWTFV